MRRLPGDPDGLAQRSEVTGAGARAAAGVGDGRARPGRQLLLDPVFGPFFAGKLASTIGVWVHNIAAAIVVWELTRSALLVGAVSVGQFLPQLVLTPWSGARADRGDRRRQLVAGRLVTAAGSLGLVAWTLAAGLEGVSGALSVIAAAVIVGTGFALGGPAMQALLPTLVRPPELPTAIALSSMPFTVARASGPAIGALLVATTGPTVAFAIAAATNLAFAAVLVRLPIRASSRGAPADGRVRAGWRYVRGDAAMTALLLGVLTVGVGADPVITLTPSVAASLGAPSSFVGVLASAFGVGAGIGFVLLTRARTRFGLARLGSAGLVVLAAGMLGLAASPTRALAVTSMLLGGAGMTFALTSLTTLVQQQVPDELRGRVMALWAVAFLGSRPVTAGLTGALADLTSARVSLLLVVVVLLLGARTARPGRTTRAPTGP